MLWDFVEFLTLNAAISSWTPCPKQLLVVPAPHIALELIAQILGWEARNRSDQYHSDS